MGIGPIRTFPQHIVDELALRTELAYAGERCAPCPFSRISEAMFQAGAAAALRSGDRETLAAMWAAVDAR